MKRVGVALIGCGVVGGAVLRLLVQDGARLACRTGIELDVRRVVVRDVNRTRALPVGLRPERDAMAAVQDPAVEVVVELVGGVDFAGAVVEAAIRAGKSVVTANKALLAERGPSLFELARSRGVGIGFEASCAGGIPVISALTQGLVANQITAVVGIVNGTCNFILTQMTRRGWTYGDALREAQRLGYAEADPALDVSGRDAAQKLALLASLALGAQVRERDIAVSGIEKVDAADIRFAGELGYVIKLLAVARRVGEVGVAGAVSLQVGPMLVPRSDVLADVSDAFNAVSVYGSPVGHVLLYGRGAGGGPTASAVVSDVIQAALGVSATHLASMPLLAGGEPVRVVSDDADRSRYYLRLEAVDRPGVLARITRVLGELQISVASFLQHDPIPAPGSAVGPLQKEGGVLAEGGSVPLVITTHHASASAMKRAVEQIGQLPDLRGEVVCLRVLDVPPEFS